MAAPQAGLSPVSYGWTGELTITVGAVASTVVPRPRTSTAALMARLIAVATQAHGGEWSVAVVAGKVELSGPAVFTLTATGAAATRTGFTGTYTGAAAYTATVTPIGDYYPANGLVIDGETLGTTQASPVSDGSTGANAAQSPGTITITVWDDHEGAWDAEADVYGTYDVWIAGRVLARCRIASWTRRRLSRDPAVVTITTTAQGVG